MNRKVCHIFEIVNNGIKKVNKSKNMKTYLMEIIGIKLKYSNPVNLILLKQESMMDKEENDEITPHDPSVFRYCSSNG